LNGGLQVLAHMSHNELPFTHGRVWTPLYL